MRRNLAFAILLASCRGSDPGSHLETSQAKPNTTLTGWTEPTLGRTNWISKSGTVVELFTSEGCSSCPPADRVLADLVANSGDEGTPAIPIAFHVDYWDDLGWKDPFSSAAASERQHWYSHTLNSSRLYTPQMIVGGTRAFVGSDRNELRRALRDTQHAKTTPTSDLRLSPDSCLNCPEKGELAISVEVTPLPTSVGLLLALVQHHAESRVSRGENAGATLRHVNVVLAFSWRQSARELNRWSLESSALAGGEDVSIVGFLQRTTDGRIIAAREWRPSAAR